MRSKNKLPVPFFLCCIFLFTACETTGACVGQYGVGKYECKEEWYETECAEWDEDEINGSEWTFHKRSSCEDLGYTIECSDGSYVEDSCS